MRCFNQIKSNKVQENKKEKYEKESTNTTLLAEVLSFFHI